MRLSRVLLPTIVFGALIVATSARADDAFDVAFGAAITSDYISRGITQTDHLPAVQGYVEPSKGIFYGGLWASNVVFGGEGDTELDTYFGIRPEMDKWSFDFGYNRTFYMSDVSDSSGEAYAKATFTPSDKITLGGQFYINPEDTGATYSEANADLTLPHSFGVSGALGYVTGDTPYATWNAGVYYNISDAMKLDLRYSDTNLSTGSCQDITGLTGGECDARVMLTFSVDTAISTITGKDKD